MNQNPKPGATKLSEIEPCNTCPALDFCPLPTMMIGEFHDRYGEDWLAWIAEAQEKEASVFDFLQNFALLSMASDKSDN